MQPTTLALPSAPHPWTTLSHRTFLPLPLSPAPRPLHHPVSPQMATPPREEGKGKGGEMGLDEGCPGSSWYAGQGQDKEEGSAQDPEQSSHDGARDQGQASRPSRAFTDGCRLAPSLLRWVWAPPGPLSPRDEGCTLSGRTEPERPPGHHSHLCHQRSLHSAFAVACGPGTHFSGEPGQCVPCAPGTYQDGDGQLSCTPCPSSDGLGLAGARNVSECGGECGPPQEGGVGVGWGCWEYLLSPLRSPKQRPGTL